MKTCALCLSLMLCLVSPVVAGDKFGLALKTGKSWTNMHVKEKSTGNIVDTDRVRESTYLLEAEIVITKHLSYVGGLQYLAHGYSARAIDSVFAYRYWRRATYVGFANKLRVLVLRGKVQPFFSVGLNAESLLSAQFRRDYDDASIQDSEIDTKVLFDESAFTPELEIGIRYKLAGFYLTLEGAYARGNENVNNVDLEEFATHERRIRDWRLLIGISTYVF